VAIPAFDVQSLLPDNLSEYFRYNGSLTTPPCHQSVLWTIFNERVKISHSQVQRDYVKAQAMLTFHIE